MVSRGKLMVILLHIVFTCNIDYYKMAKCISVEILKQCVIVTIVKQFTF